MSNNEKYLNEYLKKPYSRIVVPDEESGTYTAQIIEFPGCIAEGRSPQEAYENLENVALSWIETALEMGQEIPPPWSNNEYAGKIALRLPKSLHRQVTLAAERDGTSVNQYILMAVSETIGASEFYRHMAKELEKRLSQTAFNIATIISSNYRFKASGQNNPGQIFTIANPLPLKGLNYMRTS
jgi:predicted RNase H-like HicB family nuclease